MLDLAVLATTAVGCLDIGLPFKAHLSSLTYPAALAYAARQVRLHLDQRERYR